MQPSLYYVAYLIVVAAVCIKIMVDTRSSSKALAYILLVTLFPIIGIIFYFAVGINYRQEKLYQRKLRYNEQKYPNLEEQVREYSTELLSSQEAKLGQFYKLALFSGRRSLTSSGNEVQLLINGEQKFPVLLKALDSATHHIHIEYYIFENDGVGTQIANALIRAAQRGVIVRLIYDDFGSKALRGRPTTKLREAGVEVVPFHKLTLLSFITRINYRNHRKIVVVDGREGFVGGINVSDKYSNAVAGNDVYWRDTHLRLQGLAVLNLQHIFLTDWNFCARQDIAFDSTYFRRPRSGPLTSGMLTQIVASGPDSQYPRIMYALMQAVMLAKKEILIATPYFIPEKGFLDALKVAALSGIKIKVMVPEKGDSAFVSAASSTYYGPLLRAGIELYLYTRGFIHAKTMVCDGYVSFVGTANLDNLNFEVNAVVYDAQFARELTASFNEDLKTSVAVNLEEWETRPFYRKTFDKAAHLFAPLL